MLEIRRGTKEDIAQVAAIYDHILTESGDRLDTRRLSDGKYRKRSGEK